MLGILSKWNLELGGKQRFSDLGKESAIERSIANNAVELTVRANCINECT